MHFQPLIQEVISKPSITSTASPFPSVASDIITSCGLVCAYSKGVDGLILTPVECNMLSRMFPIPSLKMLQKKDPDSQVDAKLSVVNANNMPRIGYYEQAR